MSDEIKSRRIATVTITLDEESYIWLLDLLERSLPYADNVTPETHPFLVHMRENVEWNTLLRWKNNKKKAA